MVKEAVNLMNENIQKNGYTVVGVMQGEDTPSFAYTVGLLETYNHPELIAFGLPVNTVSALFRNVVEGIIENQVIIQAHIPYEQIANMPIEFINADTNKASAYMIGFINKYGNSRELKAMQLLWSDKQGFFPYEKEFDVAFLNSQPLLGKIV